MFKMHRSLFLLSFVISMISSISSTKSLDVKLDLIIVLSAPVDDSSIGIENLKEVFAEIPSRFELGDKKTRLGLLQTTTSSNETSNFDYVAEKILMEWSVSDSEFMGKVDDWQPNGYDSDGNKISEIEHDFDNWITAADSKMFDYDQNDRARVVVWYLTTAVHRRYSDAGVRLLKRMRTKKKVLFYVITNKEDDKLQLARSIVGDRLVRDRIFVITRESDGEPWTRPLRATLNAMFETMAIDLCAWDSMCRYEKEKENGSCILDQWRNDETEFYEDKSECDKVKPKYNASVCAGDAGDDEAYYPSVNASIKTTTMCPIVCHHYFPWTTRERYNCSIRANCGKNRVRDRDRLAEFNESQRFGLSERLGKYCIDSVYCPSCPKKGAPSGSDDEAKQRAIWIGTSCGAVAFVLIAIGVGVGVFLVYRKHKREQAEADEHVQALTDTLRTMSVHMQANKSRDGAETGMDADLEQMIEQSLSRISIKPAPADAGGRGGGGGGKSTKSAK